MTHDFGRLACRLCDQLEAMRDDDEADEFKLIRAALHEAWNAALEEAARECACAIRPPNDDEGYDWARGCNDMGQALYHRLRAKKLPTGGQ